MLILSLGVLVLVLQNTHGQGQLRACSRGLSCKKLIECPPLARKAHSPNASDRLQVRNAFCGRHGGGLLVCCPAGVEVTTKAPRPGNVNNLEGEKLLPKQCGNPIVEDKIHGGEKAPLGAYPWVVAIRYKDGNQLDYQCGASLINSRYVLTAAHCVHPGDLAGRTIDAVNIGDWDLANNGIDCEITGLGPHCAHSPRILAGYEDVIIHPEYNKRFGLSDDIALIRLDRTIDFRAAGVEPICLPPAGLDLTERGIDRLPLAAGWGLTEDNTDSNILLSVGLPFANKTVCKRRYKERFGTKQICAGGVKGKDSCNGDSGGPLVMPGPFGPPFLQIGIVSAGPRRCGTQNFPGLYTSVSHYRQWITQNLRP